MREDERRPDGQSIKHSFQSRAFQVGGYSIAAALVVIAIAVAVNLVAGAIPSAYTKLDMTESGLFTLSEQTEKVVSGLEEDVTVYWLVQSGSEDTYIRQMLDRYDDLSSALSVERVDPVVYPSFASQYTEDTVYENSLIVVAGERSTYVSYYDIYETDYSNYYVDYSVSTSFAGEGALTSAIDYVSSDDLPLIYMTSGHGEADLDATISSAIDKENFLLEEVSLITETAVPEDCDLLFIYSPQSDISTEEADLILAYLQAGGNLLLITDYTETDMPNLAGVMAEYGMEAAEGIVIDQDSAYNVQGYAYMLLPDMNSHAITSPLIDGGYYALLPVAQGLTVSDDLRDTLSATELLTTSDSAYSKVAGASITTYDREEGDIDGPFALGVAVTETTDEAETNIVWLTSAQMLDSTVDQMVSGGNQDLFLNTLGWMCDRENSITIHAKSLDTEYLTVPTSSANRLSVLLIGLLPIMVVSIGIVIVVQRRRK